MLLETRHRKNKRNKEFVCLVSVDYRTGFGSPRCNLSRNFGLSRSVLQGVRIYNNPFPPLELKNSERMETKLEIRSRLTRGDHPSVKERLPATPLNPLPFTRLSRQFLLYDCSPTRARGAILSYVRDKRFRNVFGPQLSTRERIDAAIIVVNEGRTASRSIGSRACHLGSPVILPRENVFRRVSYPISSPGCIRRAHSVRIRKKRGEKKWSKLRGEKRTMTHLDRTWPRGDNTRRQGTSWCRALARHS